MQLIIFNILSSLPTRKQTIIKIVKNSISYFRGKSAVKNLFFLLLIMVVPFCFAGKKGFMPKTDMTVDSKQIRNLNWKVMGFCDSSSQICIYLDTISGYIVQLNRINNTDFIVRDVDQPSAINTLIEGAFLTSKFREKKLKLVNKSFFSLTYEAKRGRMIIEVNNENNRIRKITIKK